MREPDSASKRTRHANEGSYVYTEVAADAAGNTPREVCERALLDLETGAEFNFADWCSCTCGRLYAAAQGRHEPALHVHTDPQIQRIANPRGRTARSAAYIEALQTIAKAHGESDDLTIVNDPAGRVSALTRRKAGYEHEPSRRDAIQMLRTTLKYLDKLDELDAPKEDAVTGVGSVLEPVG